MANRFTILKNSKIRYFDTLLLLILMLIIIFGLVMLYSVSSYDGSVNYGDSAYYLKRQLGATVFGLILMGIVAFLPYHLWEKLRVFVYLFAVLMLLLIIPFGTRVNGAKRWIYIGGVSIQPAEIAKFAIVVLLAQLLVRLGSKINSWKGLLVAVAPSVPLIGMIYIITGNLSSAIIVAAITFVLCFVASSDYKKFLIVILALIAIAALYIFIVVKNNEGGMGFRGERILAWLDPDAYASGKGYQTLQALYAIGSGGFMGKGIGESMQKLGYIPEAQNDMIFAIICEEIGFIGAVCIIVMFLLLIWRFVIIATNAPDLYGALLVVGVMSHIAIQVILNIAVVTNTIPNTGISLPFISYGGSSVVILLIEIGLVLSVQRSIKYRDVV
ncbi:MAG: putative lipid II flippase FtsW [Lachnospiraceae bacterium]|nr:putative lipid II flippase FtsW [Lachnospiraceae bacterium]